MGLGNIELSKDGLAWWLLFDATPEQFREIARALDILEDGIQRLELLVAISHERAASRAYDRGYVPSFREFRKECEKEYRRFDPRRRMPEDSSLRRTLKRLNLPVKGAPGAPKKTVTDKVKSR
jgi:hypothetical protein